jgi:hypothetical protein
MRRLKRETSLLLLGVALFATFLFKHISYPLLWQDEAETVMFGTRVLEYGYPKVHGEPNVLYEFGSNIAVGVKEGIDAYIGTTWGHFYFAVPGVLWARGADDFYAKTARLRLPFALAGAAGLAVWVLALAPVYRGQPRRAQLFAGLFFLFAALSISLVLHLREARYYSLLILLSGAIALVYLRHRVFGTLGGVPYAAALASLLFLVFHTFFAAYFFLAALLALDGIAASLRAGGDAAERLRRALGALAPILASAVLVAPFAIFFETFAIASSFREDLGFTLGGYLENASLFLVHFCRHEYLAPAIFFRLAIVGADFAARRRGEAAAPGEGRRVAALLAWFVAIYVAGVCANPLVYERYFVVLSPAVIGWVLLDAFALFDAVPRLAPPGRRRLAAAAVLVAMLAVVATTSRSRVDDVRGRLEEITDPYRGPLDFAITRIAEASPRPAELVIATNYANHPLMYYLGSHVIVGTNLNNIVRERGLDPDVVIPRLRWPRGQGELRAFLARGEYTSEALPVRDLHFNNTPALTRSRSTPDAHRSRTATPNDDDARLEIFWRSEPRPGPPASGGAGRRVWAMGRRGSGG